MAGVIVVNDLKRGEIFQIDDAPFEVLDLAFQTPSARGANMFVKVKCRNLLTGQVFDKSFRGGDKVEQPDFERRSGQFLYADGRDFVFMDKETYDQVSLSEETIGDRKLFLMDGLDVILHIYKGNVVNVDLPQVVEQTIVECDPVIKGATAQAQSKTARTETGLTLQVPSYMKEGERIKIDTRDVRYISRA
ncbi:MAG: elongation factor P [bacterium]